MNHLAPESSASLGEVPGTFDIHLLDHKRLFLTAVHIRECGTVEDDLRCNVLNLLHDLIPVRDIQILSIQGNDLMLSTEHLPALTPKHTFASCKQDLHLETYLLKYFFLCAFYHNPPE